MATQLYSNVGYCFFSVLCQYFSGSGQWPNFEAKPGSI